MSNFLTKKMNGLKFMNKDNFWYLNLLNLGIKSKRLYKML